MKKQSGKHQLYGARSSGRNATSSEKQRPKLERPSSPREERNAKLKKRAAVSEDEKFTIDLKMFVPAHARET
jgi:hypothetical protein